MKKLLSIFVVTVLAVMPSTSVYAHGGCGSNNNPVRTTVTCPMSGCKLTGTHTHYCTVAGCKIVGLHSHTAHKGHH